MYVKPIALLGPCLLMALASLGCGSSAPSTDQATTAPATPPAKTASGDQTAAPAKKDKNDLTGKWKIDLSKSAPEMSQQMAKMPQDMQKLVTQANLEFLPDGKFKESLMGAEMSGKYELKGNSVVFTPESKPGMTMHEDPGVYDAAADTITFSPGPKRIVFVRSKP